MSTSEVVAAKTSGVHLSSVAGGLAMLSNRWSILAMLFAVRAGRGLQYEVLATLLPLFATTVVS
jgi:hypothetical protein